MPLYTRWADMVRESSPAPSGRGPVFTRSFYTPWGRGTVSADARGLLSVKLPPVARVEPSAESGRDRAGGVAPAEDTREVFAGAGDVSEMVLSHWVGELEAYFRRERLSWRSECIPWASLGLSRFERSVYEALLTVPAGRTVGYGALANAAGHPGAARAVGGALAGNPIPVIIPCHRVIRADGTLGGYAGSPEWKARLLRHELPAERAGLAG